MCLRKIFKRLFRKHLKPNRHPDETVLTASPYVGASTYVCAGERVRNKKAPH